MIDLLQTAFQKTHQRYCKILNNYYPSHKSTGFTERNLTKNFVLSLELLLGEKSISWFEAPINLETGEHIDAVVFDLEHRCSIMVESKRFSNPSEKKTEAKSDIGRLKNSENHALLERELRGVTIESRYGILLADVWLETKPKFEIFDTWPDCICNKEDTVWYEKCGFGELMFDEKWKEHYKLLIAVFKL